MNLGMADAILVVGLAFVTFGEAAAVELAFSRDCQTASADLALVVMNGVGPLPSPAAIWAMERPDATELSSLVTAPASPSTANSSWCLISSQLSRFSPTR